MGERPLAVAFLLLTLPIAVVARCPVPLTSDPDDRAGRLEQSKLNGYFQCNPADPPNDLSPCNSFVGRALKELFGLNDFASGSGYMTANVMAEKLSAGFKDWKPLGPLLDKENSYCAQSLANKGYPVIASLQQPGHGHVALVLPGKVSDSASWGIPAPNSASFSLGNVQRSYVAKPMSASFGNDNAKVARYYYKEIRPF